MAKKVRDEIVEPEVMSAEAPPTTATPLDPNTLLQQLAAAIGSGVSTAIESSRPPQRKSQINRKRNTPWTPKDGTPKLKLKVACYQHGLELREERLFNEQIALLNRLRPGIYLDGHVKVIRRRDRGLNIDYPMRTAAQRMRLSAVFGITSLTDLLKRLVEDGDKRPKNVEFDERD